MGTIVGVFEGGEKEEGKRPVRERIRG